MKGNSGPKAGLNRTPGAEKLTLGRSRCDICVVLGLAGRRNKKFAARGQSLGNFLMSIRHHSAPGYQNANSSKQFDKQNDNKCAFIFWAFGPRSPALDKKFASRGQSLGNFLFGSFPFGNAGGANSVTVLGARNQVGKLRIAASRRAQPDGIELVSIGAGSQEKCI